MALTRSDIRDLIKENIHNDASIGNARLNSWINLAQDEVETRFLSRYLRQKSNIVTTADVAEYVLIEANFRSFLQFWQEDTPLKLKQMAYQDFVRKDPNPDSTGKPQWWMFQGFTSGFPQVRFHFIPDAAYPIFYEFVENLPDMTDDADISLLSQIGWPNLLVLGGTKRYYQIHSQADYASWKGQFDEELRAFKLEWKSQISEINTYIDAMESPSIVDTFHRFPSNFPRL